MWEPGSVAPACICWGELKLFLYFHELLQELRKKRFKKYQSPDTAIYLCTLWGFFFCVFLSTFALIKQREFHHLHNHVEAVPEASLRAAEPRERGPPWCH